MVTENEVREILRKKTNYIIRSVFEVSDHYGMLKEKGGIDCVVLPYRFLKRVLFVIQEDYERLGIGSWDDPKKTGQMIDRLMDEVLETYFLESPLTEVQKDGNGQVYVSGYLEDEEKGRVSLFFAALLCRKADGGQELDEDERFFVEFIEEYGRPEYLTQFAAPKFFGGPVEQSEKPQNRPYQGWEERLGRYMNRLKKELRGVNDNLRDGAEEQLARKLSYVSGEETGGETNDQ